MMSKSKSPLSRGWRVLYLLPLVCLAIGLQARTVYVPVDKDSEKLSADEKFEYVLDKVTVVKYAPATVKAEDVIHVNSLGDIQLSAGKNFDTAPECSENFSHWLTGRLTYPAACLYDGTLVAMFVVGEDGKVGNVEIISGLCEELDKTVVSLIGKSPEWTPALKDGKPVATVLFQPVTFMIRTSNNAAQDSPIVLIVRPDGRIENGGKVYTKDQIKDIVPAHKPGEPQITVQIVAAENVPVGVIDDVKTELRKLESLKVRYASASGQEGVTRLMPPYPQADNAKKEDYPEVVISPGVKRENLFVVRINSADRVFFGDKPRQDDEEMLQMGKTFLKKHGRNTCFSLTADRGTSYGTYQHMQELLAQIYSEVRDEKAHEVYGKALVELSEEELQNIYKMVPMNIVEASPKG